MLIDLIGNNSNLSFGSVILELMKELKEITLTLTDSSNIRSKPADKLPIK